MSNELYFTSDPHLDHQNIIKYCKRPFSSLIDMNHTIISRWNQTVPKDRPVYCLGDLAFCRSDERFRELVSQLNGKIHLILGNHDNIQQIMRNEDLFESISNFKEIRHEGERITLCHYGMRSWNASHHGAWMLYGHSHGMLPMYGKSVDVGVDVWDFTPVSFTTLSIFMGARLTVKDHMPETRIIEEMKTLTEEQRAAVLSQFQ